MNKRLALLLLVVGLVDFYAWQWVPPDHVSTVFAMTSQWHVAVLLLVAGLLLQDALVWWVLAYQVACSLLVVGCNAWFLADPWPVEPDGELCSAKLNWPLGTIGLVLFLVLAGGVYMSKRRGSNDAP